MHTILITEHHILHNSQGEEGHPRRGRGVHEGAAGWPTTGRLVYLTRLASVPSFFQLFVYF